MYYLVITYSYINTFNIKLHTTYKLTTVKCTRVFHDIAFL